MMTLLGADPYFVAIVAFGVLFMIVKLGWLTWFFIKKSKEERANAELAKKSDSVQYNNH